MTPRPLVWTPAPGPPARPRRRAAPRRSPPPARAPPTAPHPPLAPPAARGTPHTAAPGLPHGGRHR
eukprot:10875912-Prorocentrum_lima.AAC.1